MSEWCKAHPVAAAVLISVGILLTVSTGGAFLIIALIVWAVIKLSAHGNPKESVKQFIKPTDPDTPRTSGGYSYGFMALFAFVCGFASFLFGPIGIPWAGACIVYGFLCLRKTSKRKA